MASDSAGSGGRAGNPLEIFAAHSRLGEAELERMRAALAPAFALGLSQAMETPARWAELANAFLAMAPAAGGGGRSGETLLDAVFGRGPLREAVGAQAAAMAGVAPGLMQRMMPLLAEAGVEAMMRGAMANFSPNRLGAGPTDLGGAMAEMMRRGANAVEALSRPSDALSPRPPAPSPFSPAPYADAFNAALRGMFGAPVPAPPPRAPAPPPAAPTADPVLPFALMFDAFAKGLLQASQALPGAAPTSAAAPPAAAPAPVPAPPPPAGPPVAAGQDLFATFLREGQRAQDGYFAEMRALFERHAPRDADPSGPPERA